MTCNYLMIFALLGAASAKTIAKRDVHPTSANFQQVFLRPLPTNDFGGINNQHVSHQQPAGAYEGQPEDFGVPFPAPHHQQQQPQLHQNPYTPPTTTTPLPVTYTPTTTTTTHRPYSPHVPTPTADPSVAGYGHQEAVIGTAPAAGQHYPSNQGPFIPSYQPAVQHTDPPSGYGPPAAAPSHTYHAPTAAPSHDYQAPSTTTTPKPAAYNNDNHHHGPEPAQAIALQPVVDSYGTIVGYLIPAAVVRPDGPSVFAIVPNQPKQEPINDTYAPPATTTPTTTTTTPPPPPPSSPTRAHHQHQHPQQQGYPQDQQFSLVPVYFQGRQHPHPAFPLEQNAYATL